MTVPAMSRRLFIAAVLGQPYTFATPRQAKGMVVDCNVYGQRSERKVKDLGGAAGNSGTPRGERQRPTSRYTGRAGHHTKRCIKTADVYEP